MFLLDRDEIVPARHVQRPDIEQVVATYEEMSAKVGERLTAELGRTWEQVSEGGASGCGSEFPGLTGDVDIRHLPRWSSKGNLPDDQWSRAEAIVGEVAEGYGFGKQPAVIVNRPSDHEVVYKKPDGAQISFGTAVNTPPDVRTGCHLKAEVHKRGAPSRKS
ncbi:hypothetical protein GCM10022267_35800 [Lentzea roselyniae]|uniref:Lipoprotein n=1 Tax=Lentzea roselyniae TaxID=531940 RepID=A0ABP7B2I8_9PSEU